MRNHWRKGVGIAIGGAAVGACLFALMVQGERTTLDGSMEWCSRAGYRVASLAVYPVGRLSELVWPRGERHWSTARTLLACLATGLALVGSVAPHARNGTPPGTDGTGPARPARRRFLARAAKSSVGVAAVGAGAFATFLEPERLRVRHYTIGIPQLPLTLDGLRVLQISDTHYGPFVTLAYLRAVIERGNQLKPDIVLLTGDYVHRTSRAIEPGIGVMKELKPRIGVMAVLGNHDHWEGAEACRAAFRALGIPLIDNRRLFLTRDGLRAEPTKDSLCIAGVGDLWEDAVDLEGALGNVPDGIARILLSHNPDVAEDPRLGLIRADLMLSGHTHGGQVWLPGLGTPVVPSRFGARYAGGLCQGPHCPVVVSRGVGMAILPVRFLVPPEIGLVTLTRGGG